jgi:hypothetical protein
MAGFIQPFSLKGQEMKGLAKGSGMWGHTTKLASAAAAVLLLAPIPALGFTFLSLWSSNITTMNAPLPAITTSDFATGTNLAVDMGATALPGKTALGAFSYFSAYRDISVGPAGENVSVVRSYQTLLQGASLQSIVYFVQTSGGAAGKTVDILPSAFNSAGIRFGRSFSFRDSPAANVNLGPGTYTVFVRLKYKRDRFGIWDNSQALPGSPHTFTISSATGP